MPAEIHPVGTFPASEAQPNQEVSKIPLEDLQKLVEWPSKMAEFVEERSAPEPAPEPPAPVETPVETPAPEPAVEATPAAEPEKVEPTPTQEDIDKELLRAQVDAIEAHAKKLEAKLTGREAGERGYIQQLKREIDRLKAGGEPEEASYRPEPIQETTPAPRSDGIKAWAIQKASQEALNDFVNSHPDVKDMETQAVKYLQESGFDARNIYQLEDPIAAGREVTRALDEMYWHLRETAGRARISELQTRKADQIRGLEEAKRRAAPSASGSPPVQASPPKTTRDLSLAELEAKMKALRSAGR